MTIVCISGVLYSLLRAFSYVFLPDTYFGLPKNPLGGILGRKYYLHFTDEEIEV